MDDLTRLLVAARGGDRAALAAAIRCSQTEVWRLAANLVSPQDADDVAQDTFVRMWRALPAFRAEASGRTWLLAIARRACADAVRQLGRRRRLASRLEHEHPAAPAGGFDAAGLHAVAALVGTLERSRREAFVLTQVVGCSYDEAAAVCGVPVGTIRSRVARARADLVTALGAADTG